MALTGKLTKKLVENLGPGRHGDGSGVDGKTEFRKLTPVEADMASAMIREAAL